MAGLSLMGLGTAVGAATEGYMRGEKHRSDMEDAEARRGLVKLQTDEANIKVGQLRREERYQNELAQIYQDEKDTPDVPTTAAPAAAPASAPAQGAIATPGQTAAPVTPTAAPAAGIATPGGKTPSGDKADFSDLSKMQRIIQKRQQLDLQYGKITEIQAMQGMKAFKQLQDEGVIDAMEYFRRTGDREGAITRMNSTGQIKLDPGAQFTIEQREIAPGVKVPNVVVTSPDGKHSFNQYDAMVSALNPKDALSFRTETGIKLADLALKATAEENLNKYRQGMLEQRGIEVEATVERYKNENRVALARLTQIAEERKDALAAKALKDRQTASETALDGLLKGFGISKNMKESDLMMLPKERQAEIRANLSTAFSAHALWEMNVSATNKQTFAPSEAPRVLKQIASTPADKFEVDSDGVFTMYQGKKVYAPIDPNAVREAKGEKTQAPAATPGAAPAAAAPAAPAPANQRPGLTQPPTIQETQAQFRTAQAYITKQRDAAAADPDLRELKLRQEQAMRNGRAVEANNFLSQRNQLLRQRYNITPLGGIVDASQVGQQ